MRKLNLIVIFSLLLAQITLLESASKKPVKAFNGMVVSSDSLATKVGIEILKKGGNAVDAAVAVGFALAVTYPQAGNIGGGGFMVIRMANGETVTIDYREKAPLKAHEDMFLDENGNFIPEKSQIGHLSVGVPGSVAGLLLALEKYGTMSRKEVLNPAIKLAEKGFIVNEGLANAFKNAFEHFKKFPSTMKYFSKNGEPYKEGDKLIQKDLAKVLKLIRDKGRDGFYKGKVADLIVAEMKRGGGIITHEDLENYQPVIRKPVIGTYRGYEIISMGPPSSGGVCLIELLNILENFDLKKYGFGSSYTIHYLVEAMKRVYADRAEYLGDPDFVEIPLEKLLSKEYAKTIANEIDTLFATPSSKIVRSVSPPEEGSHTTHYSVVDKWGNVVSVTTTINSYFGSMVAVDGAGFFLNNEMDDFSAKPGTPNQFGLLGNKANSIQPGKRMLSSMTPTIVLKNGKPFLILGSPGGSTIITSVLQVILNVIDFGMNIQEAVDAPRIHHQWYPDVVYYEKRGLPLDVIENLGKRGHKLVERRGFQGEVQAILIDENGVKYGAADPRGYGFAMGY
ncbi:gamma-glutamyltransferase 1 . Threonine peptidase. MEROPS family T03 [Candidatus Kryptonium thompsonii]|nr:gamma-glutamyltransferase [Candidatus Kryptonium thompsoni]CUS78091.1 gamma-glutamyltransferase 1 . Threonine peptidase. MEROPS family T03 [Candidatus Kryptonium thompsoni]CUS82878.1 gamma-glutamyltransferase 1 . Threonine peptidase. MEROPS family T03 [Candidatus Kryptonium thompsoni]CUS86092.1 gamma-glutamyltransferase 1 . Threonine peptidase. MEROPS family T03 [Candidatus Kryptonium thompsoni]CUS88908.1 gamma-glutamyltransferase 1 . Threonine peptidase. MEROPS family T03 [Candidatus Krypto